MTSGSRENSLRGPPRGLGGVSGFKSGCSQPTLSSTRAFSALCCRALPSGEHAQDIWASGGPRSAVINVLTGSHMDKTPVQALSCSRDGLYGLADLTCWPALIGRPVHRSVDARRSGDERRRSPSSPYMNSTISLLGECSRRRLSHLTVAGLSFPRRPRTCYWVSAIARPCSSEHRNHIVCI